MNLQKRISSLAELGTTLSGLILKDRPENVSPANDWFTRSELTRALLSWSALLTGNNLTRWTDPYPIADDPPLRNILVITAGNIPLVGFHDFLSVLISGNCFHGKLSWRDDQLLVLLAKELIRIEPGFSNQIHIRDFTIVPDAVIATGSNNSSRYFRMEYGRIPNIIRKNRSSAAVLDGSETPDELENLTADITEYYGLGCRSVSHLFLPAGYAPESLLQPLSSCNHTDPCMPYVHNLGYQRARLAMLKIPFFDCSQTLLVESDSLHSPIGVVHYSFYTDRNALFEKLEALSSELQCLIGHKSLYFKLLPFGSAQKPELWEYADGVDTLEFLNQLV
jgi:hypothetical protein